MIEFEKHQLDNGLTIIIHKDKTTPIVAFNLMYHVGSKNESPELTGFAHLFEHLMFEGSVNVPNYDFHVQNAGGDNNAYTSTDVTNYYLTLPKQNLETAFWLESDRMLGLDFTQERLDTQRNVVIEEFKQRYLNQPYGDVWLKLRPLAYEKHSYRWPTIGKSIEHIEKATLDNVQDFFNAHYCPDNAVLTIGGDVETQQVLDLAQKWFGDIRKTKSPITSIEEEAIQTSARQTHVQSDVPLNGIYKAYHMPAKSDPNYYTIDLVSDILSRGRSSRMYNSLVKEQQLFSEVSAFVSGEFHPGLFIVSGKLRDGVSMDKADESIQAEIEKIKTEGAHENELQKVKNKVLSAQAFSETSVLNKAMSLSSAELLKGAELVNQEPKIYEAISNDDIMQVSQEHLKETNCSTLYYQKN